jgi:hypothetical protein
MLTAYVVVDLYSGRESPAWELTAAESAELLSRLGRLHQKASGGSLPPNGLGYNGLQLRVATPGAVPEVYRIAKGLVLNGRGRWFEDPGGGLEGWLLRTGRGVLTPELMAWLLDASR